MDYMQLLHVLLHVDQSLGMLIEQYGTLIYVVLFLIVFCETGLVVFPFLPGDSLLFIAGAFCATGAMNFWLLLVLLVVAAISGNTVNYSIGRRIGQRAFSGRYRFFKVSHLTRTQEYFQRYGGLTVLLSRLMPIIRTFAPFVAGIGCMPYHRFQMFNVVGGLAWVALFIFGGFAFGNLPWVQAHFSIVTLIVIAISLLPMAVVAIRARFGAAAPRA